MPKEPKTRVQESIELSCVINQKIINAEYLYHDAELVLKQANELLHKKYPEVDIVYCGGDGCIFIGNPLESGAREEHYSLKDVVERYGIR